MSTWKELMDNSLSLKSEGKQSMWGGDDWGGSTGGSYKPGGKTYSSCHATHAVINVGAGKLHGGSCSGHNLPKNTSLRVGLCRSTYDHVPGFYPWEGKTEVLLHITNYGVPSSFPDFNGLVTHIVERLAKGEVVHVGCMAGHGRTGMVLAAVVAQAYEQGLMTKAPSPDLLKNGKVIQWVRQHYCKKAVETPEQVAWLVDNYGVATADARHKDFGKYTPGSGSSIGNRVMPIPSSKNIWVGQQTGNKQQDLLD